MEFVEVMMDGEKYTLPKTVAQKIDSVFKGLKKLKNDKDEHTPFSWQGGDDNMPNEENKEVFDENMSKEEMVKKMKDMAGEMHSMKKKMDEHEEKMKAKEKEDEKEEEKKDGEQGTPLKKEVAKPEEFADSKKVAKMVERQVNDRAETLDSCKKILDSKKYEEIKSLSTREMKVKAIEKLSPSVKIDSDDSDSYVDGLFRGLVASKSSESKLDSVLIEHATSFKDGSNPNKEIKIDGTPFKIARTPQDAFENDKKAWNFSSIEDYMDACRKTQQVDYTQHLSGF